MKKFTLMMVVMLACLFRANAQEPQFVSKEQQNRNVIIEEFTGRNCPNCPDGHNYANRIVANNPGRVWSVNIHEGGFSPTSYPNLNTSVSSEIASGFSIAGYPMGVINRSTNNALGRGEWEAAANTQLSQAAECNVAGRAVINEATRVATITVEVYYTGNSAEENNYLTVLVLQDSILGSQSGASYNPSQIVNGEYCHMHILRDVATPTWGEQIFPTTAGSLVTKQFVYEIPEVIGNPNGVEVNLDHLQFLAVVTEKQQGKATRPVLNVNKLSIVKGTDEPIYPFIKSVAQEDLITCDKEKKFTVNVVNGGTEVLTSIKFEISVNNGETTTQEWTGSIPVYENVNIDMFAEVPFGGELVTVKIVEANGEEFSFEESVMAQSEEWIQVELGDTQATEQFKLELAQDRFGNQTTWQVIGHNDKVIASGGPYKLLPQSGIEVHEEYFTIPVGECVRFIIEDNVGNGINNNFGQGYYKIYDSKGNILVESDGKFGYGEYHIIYVNGEGGDNPEEPGDNPEEPGDDNDTLTAPYMRLANVYSDDGFESWDYVYSGATNTDLVCINEIDFTTNTEVIDSLFYDERGNIIKLATWYKTEGGWIYTGYIEYEYNDKNQKTSRTNYNNFGNGFELGGIYRYYYDEEGKMTEWALEFFGIDEYQKWIIEYNEDGLKDTETMQQFSFESYYLENQFLTDYKYDANNNVKRINEFVWDGETWELQHFKLYEYDEFGNCLVAEQTTASGTVQERKVYTYDTSVSAENVFYYPNPENDYPQLPESKKHLLKSFEYWAQNDDMQLSYVTTYVMDYEVVEGSENPGGDEPEEPGDGEEPEEPADTTLLAAPQNLRAVIRQDVPGYSYKYEITMMWDAVEGAKGYEVFVNTADTSGFQMGYTNRTAFVAGSNEEITFEFYVVAYNDSIDSKPSEVYTVTVGDEPDEPENPGGDEPNDPENPGGDEPNDPENPGGDEPDEPENPGGDEPDEPENPGGDEPVDPENPGGDEPVDPENPGGDEPVDPENPGGDEPADPENPGGDEPEQPAKTYSVIAVANPENAGTVEGTGVYAENMNVTLVATAKSGYKFVNWTENGVIVSTEAEYSFVITNNRNLTANFVSTNCKLTVVINPEEAGNVEGAGTYKKDTEVKLIATANPGYKFVNWTENDAIVSTNPEYSFVITDNTDLVANFVSTENISELTSSFSIYPNPVNDKLYIETQTLTQTLTVEIYDVYGRQQSTVNGQQSTVIDVTNLNSGVYFVMIKTNEGVVKKRFVKN